MGNGYFQLVNVDTGYGLKLIPPMGGGKDIQQGEVIDFLDTYHIEIDTETLKQALKRRQETILHLGEGACPVRNETFDLYISKDYMSVTVRFMPPSETGKRILPDDFMKELQHRKITYGLQNQIIEEHFRNPVYNTDIMIALGKAPRTGTDARIEYLFNTEIEAKPRVREDGSVDYYTLELISHCNKGDVLARMIPEDLGEEGRNVFNLKLLPKRVKTIHFKYGSNVSVSNDHLSLISLVDGQVMMEGDKVVVSNIYEVENVDLSTGNISFDGTVRVRGEVQSNMKVKAKGDVIVDGAVEGAEIVAGGDIIIARGMNGMSKGILNAGGNIVAMFLENAKATAGRSVSAGAIFHSHIIAGSNLEVTGKKGFITGGYINAREKIIVKTLGSERGSSTLAEVGVDPEEKKRYHTLQKEINDIYKEIKNTQEILETFKKKIAKGVQFTKERQDSIIASANKLKEKTAELSSKNEEYKELQEMLNKQNTAELIVTGVVYPGTKVVIGDASKVIQNAYHNCKFVNVDGDVKMEPIS